MANPLYPGYYPGKPVYRDKRPWTKPEEVNLGDFEQVLSNANESLSNSPLNFPKWLIDQEIDNLKAVFTLKAKDFSKEDQIFATRDEALAFGEGDATSTTTVADDAKIEVQYGIEGIEDIPGASVRMKLDFKKMFEDPGEYLKKTFVTGPWQSIRDEDEMQALARAEILKEVITDEKSPFYLGIKGITPEETKQRLTAAVSQLAPKTKDVDAILNSEYARLGDATYKFAKNSASERDRNSKFNNFNEQMLSTLSQELELKSKSGAVRKAGIDSSTAAMVNSSRKNLVARSSVVSSLSSLSNNLGGVQDHIGQDKIGYNKKGKAVYKERYFSPFGGAVDPSEITRLKDEIKKVQNNINSLSAADRNAAANVQSYLNKLNNGLNRYVDATGKVIDAKGLSIFLKTEGSRLYRGNFDQGLAGALSSKFARATANDKNLQAVLNIRDSSGDKVFSDAAIGALKLHGKLQTDWDYETLDSLITSIKDGKLPTQFLWSRVIQPRIETYTPSYWVGRGVEWFQTETAFGRSISTALYKYQNFWTDVQNKLVKKLPFIGVVGRKNWEALKRKIADLIAEAITKGLELATEGIGLIFDRIIKVVVRFAVEKTMDFGMNLWKTMVKLDFEAAEEMLLGAGKMLLPVVAGCLTPFACLGFIIMLVIVLFISVLPQDDATKEPGPIGELINRMLPWFGGFRAEDCPLEDALALPYDNTSANPAAYEAYDLVNALKRGFWCYWNHHPEYDDASDRIDLWDEIMFQFNAFPAALNECADCLFWCTWLPYVAYQNAGIPFDNTISYLGAENMNNWFEAQAASGSSGFTYIKPTDPGACGSVQEGDIVFWNVQGGTGWHVSMVYKSDSGSIQTIHSNAPYKNLPLMCGSGGAIQNPPGDLMTVVGFGRPAP